MRVQHTLELLVLETLLHQQLFELLDALLLYTLLLSGLVPKELTLVAID